MHEPLTNIRKIVTLTLIGFVATQVAWPAFTGADLEAQKA